MSCHLSFCQIRVGPQRWLGHEMTRNVGQHVRILLLPLRCDKARAGKGDQPHCHVLETHARATKTLQSSGLRSREAEKTRDRGLGGEARQVKK